MNSKNDRIKSSINNVMAAISYYLKDVESNYLLHKITRKEYIKLVNDLNSINELLSSLLSKTFFEDKKLNEIRVINLSTMSLYEDDDYMIIYEELCNINNVLCKKDKDYDKKKLGAFKRLFNGLPTFYQYRLSKAEKSSIQEIRFRDKGFDNVQFINGYYLNTKYNFKKIAYDQACINPIYQQQIDECTKIIEANGFAEETKIITSSLRHYIIKFAKAEVVLSKLLEMKELCTIEPYTNLSLKIDGLIDKYKVMYEDNKDKYIKNIQKLKARNDFHKSNKINQEVLINQKEVKMIK